MRYTLAIAASTVLLCNTFVNAIATPTNEDIITLRTRRIQNIVDTTLFSVHPEDVAHLKANITSTGIWPDVDLTAGCGARLSNWPAIEHLTRTRILASTYIANPKDTVAFNRAISALNYWFDNDFTQSDCVDDGGIAKGNCPCGTPGLWNKNWYAQVIAVPRDAGDTCLLLRKKLTTTQKDICTRILARSFAKVTNPTPSLGNMTGANLLDVSSNGISLGLLNDDASTLKTALEHFYGGVVISPTVAGDGIQSDGSFMQHNGLLYNGNYGKDYINDLLSIFVETKDTPLEPSVPVQNAFNTLISGSEWMIMADIKLNKLLWQYSTIGRMVTLRYSDKLASSGVAINFKKIIDSSEGWEKEKFIDEITDRLTQPSTEDANQGNLVGTRYFYNADYMVHRAPTYITTLKMYSSRTVNSECINVQNPFGFHLSDGAIYNYLSGDEYVDVFGAWDWELIPGTTVDIGGTPLVCKGSKTKGKRSFVGGATDGNTGIAVMDYLNPKNGNLEFKKTAFFFPSGYAIQIGPIDSRNKTAQLVTVLDSRKRNGDIYVSGKKKNTDTTYLVPKTNSIWHDKIGYYFPSAESLFVNSRPKAANWPAIGISVGNETQQLWTSYIKHPITNTTGLLTQYVVQPNIKQSTFADNVASNNIPIALAFKASSPLVNAAYSAADNSIALAFWTAGSYKTPWRSITVTTDQPCVILIRNTASKSYRITVADPSQSSTLEFIKLNIKIGNVTKSATFALPSDVLAGRYVVKTLTF